MVEQKELQNVLNHKQEEVLGLQEKVEVLEAQVRSQQQSRDRLATDLQLAEEVAIEQCDHVTSHEICSIRKRSCYRNSCKLQNLTMRMQIFISKCVYSNLHLMHSYTCMCIHTQTHTNIHTHTQTYTHAQTYTHTRKHTHTQTYTHANIHTRKHTHT